MLEDIGYKIMKKREGEERLFRVPGIAFREATGSRLRGWVWFQPGGIPPDSNYLYIGGVVNEQQAHSLKTPTPVDNQWIYRVFTSVGFSGY